MAERGMQGQLTLGSLLLTPCTMDKCSGDWIEMIVLKCARFAVNPAGGGTASVSHTVPYSPSLA